MPVHVAWENEDQLILIYHYTGRWTWDEHYEAMRRGAALIDAVAHPVDVIVDMRRNAWFPPNTLGEVPETQKASHPRVGMRVLVGKEMNHDILQVLASKYPELLKRYTYATSMAEARRLIAERRAQRQSKAGLPPTAFD